MNIEFDGTPIPIRAGDSVLTAVLRSGRRPWRGCLCGQGDCPNCLVTVDGHPYARACQTPAQPGMSVSSHPDTGNPPFPDANRTPIPEFEVIHCEAVVIGQGRSGKAAADQIRAAGLEVVIIDSRRGQHAVGIYAGPEVVVRTPEGMARIFCQEVVVATGAAEVQPVCSGNRLAGILTPRAAQLLAGGGVPLGRVVAVGEAPEGVAHRMAGGRLARFEGEGSIRAVVTVDEAGDEQVHPCDTVVVGLGTNPRDVLARMASGIPGVRTVGSAAGELDRPSVPETGLLCPCSGVTVDDLRSVWERGFHELELIKRATLAGTGICQGSVCMPHVRSFVAAGQAALPQSFTARPVATQITMAEAAAGLYHPAHRRTALHDRHLAMGARMERSAGWYRPWTYGDPEREYWAVRSKVSICDVSTLGKFIVAGRDAEVFLERIYPARIAAIRPGNARYVLALDLRGYVFDDGLVGCAGPGRYLITSTSAGADHFEMWLRDWAESWELDVRILDRTASWGAINVTGPHSRRLLSRLRASELPPFMGHASLEVAGVDCWVIRSGFTGELSYEIHYPAGASRFLWDTLMEEGADLGIRPHGLEVLEELRLEKGHLLVGVDSRQDSTPRRLGMDRMIPMDKPYFVGRAAVARTSRTELDRLLVGLEMHGPTPPPGAILRDAGRYAGFVTSSARSRVLGRSVMLAWLEGQDGRFAHRVMVDGRLAHRVRLPFYDPEGDRARA